MSGVNGKWAIAAFLVIQAGSGASNAEVIQVTMTGVVTSVNEDFWTAPVDIQVGVTPMTTTFLYESTTPGTNSFESATYTNAMLRMIVTFGSSSVEFIPEYEEPGSGYSQIMFNQDGGFEGGIGNAYIAEYFLGFDDFLGPHYAGVGLSTAEQLGPLSPFFGLDLIAPPGDYPYTFGTQFIDLVGFGGYPEIEGSITSITSSVIPLPATGLLFAGALGTIASVRRRVAHRDSELDAR